MWFYVRELPKAQTGSGSGFKASQKTGNGLKSHPTDWEKPGNEPASPGLQDIGLSPTPRWLLFKLTLENSVGLKYYIAGNS